MKAGVAIDRRRLDQMLKAVQNLEHRDVLVGIPGENTQRGESINNATLGYLFETGAPEINMPARPWLFPSIASVGKQIAGYLRQAAIARFEGRPEVADKALHAAGTIAENAAKNRIREGIPPPLAESTLRRRARRKRGMGLRVGKGAAAELAARASGAAPSMDFAKPLIDSGQFLRSITHILRGPR